MNPSYAPPFDEIALSEIDQLSKYWYYLAKRAHVLKLKQEAKDWSNQCAPQSRMNPSDRSLVDDITLQHCNVEIQRRLAAAEFTLHSHGCVYSSQYNKLSDRRTEMMNRLDNMRTHLWPDKASLWSVVSNHGVGAPWVYWSTSPKWMARVECK